MATHANCGGTILSGGGGEQSLEVLCTIDAKERWMPVVSLRHASQLVRSLIEQQGIGAGDWYASRHTGNVRNSVTKRVVAHVSYNGRTWNAKRTQEEDAQ